MAHILKDRVKETTTSTGTGTIDLGGASSGYQSFLGAGYSDDDTVYYTVVSSDKWEVGIGTLGSTTTRLARTTILDSSNSGSKITLAGTSEVFVVHPADKTVHTDPQNPTPAIQGVAFWHDDNSVAYDSLLVWDSGVVAPPPGNLHRGRLTITGKTKTSSSYTDNKINTDDAIITFDCEASNLHSVVLLGNRTLEASGVSVGQKIVVRLEQDGTGSRGVTWFDHVKWAEGGTTPVLTSTENKTDVYGFIVASGDGAALDSNYWYDGFVIGRDI
jgi:hypothetical protein